MNSNEKVSFDVYKGADMGESSEKKRSKAMIMLGRVILAEWLNIRPLNKKWSTLSIILWIAVAMLVVVVLILLPLVCVLAYKGLFFGSVGMLVSVTLLVGLSFGLLFGFGFDLSSGLLVGIIASLFSVAMSIEEDIMEGILVPNNFFVSFIDSFSGIDFVFFFIVSFGFGFLGGIVFGFLVIVFTKLLIVSFFKGLIIGLVSVSILGIAMGIDVGFASGLGFGVGIFSGTSFVILLWHGTKEFGKGGLESARQFFTPWRQERLYFGRSMGFFVMLYMVFVLLFALWFYAIYLNAAKELPTPAVTLILRLRILVQPRTTGLLYISHS